MKGSPVHLLMVDRWCEVIDKGPWRSAFAEATADKAAAARHRHYVFV
jgi:hypothetical protein